VRAYVSEYEAWILRVEWFANVIKWYITTMVIEKTMTECGSKRGYDGDTSDFSDGEDVERPPKKPKRDCIDCNDFGPDYEFSEHGDSMQDVMSTASCTRRAETDTEVDSESPGSQGTIDDDSPSVTVTLGTDDTISSVSFQDSSDEFDESDHESSSGDESDDGFGDVPEIDFDDRRSEASTV